MTTLQHCLIVFVVSMVPLIELRGAIPYGVMFGLPLWLTFVIAIVGNMLPVPIIFFFARRVLEWGADKPVIGKIFTFFLEKGHKGGEKLAETETDLLELRTDATDAFDTLLLGCILQPYKSTGGWGSSAR